MSVADPVCPRCRRRMVFIGLGPAAEPACVACKDGPRCPQCRSVDTEPFRVQRTSWSLIAMPENSHHCVPCGHVFIPEDP